MLGHPEACTAAYATHRLSAGFVVLKFAAILAGVLVMRFALFPLTAALLRRFPTAAGRLDPNLIACACCLMFALGLYTKAIGIFTIFGGFAAPAILTATRAGYVLAPAWYVALAAVPALIAALARARVQSNSLEPVRNS